MSEYSPQPPPLARQAIAVAIVGAPPVARVQDRPVMADLRVAFWNVQNLYEPGTRKNGPTDEPELIAKLDAIARILDGLFAGAGPDLVGLAEVHTERILELLEQRLRDR
ncbi:hypothetical protein ACSRUE_27000 [Sorangium sp. KYC3313]|uniref:hypothetical protein n=1 Tax=Sorangium sp. KYC3313 TaxID=3449740 RepID=UPI003F8CC67D